MLLVGQDRFTFLVPAHPGSPEKRAIKRVYVCVYMVEKSSKSIEEKFLQHLSQSDDW